MILMLLAQTSLSTVATAQDIPASVQAWSDGLAETYAHYASVEPAWEPESDVFPPCPRPGEPIPTAPRSSMTESHRAAWDADPARQHASCQALRPGGWRLQLRLSPHDQRIFSPAVLRVSQVDAPDAEAVISKLVDHGIWAARSYQAVVPIGTYLLELNVPCGASSLFAYELADLVTAAVAAHPDPKPASPQRIAVSGCGRMSFEMVDRTEIARDGAREREIWTFHFPQHRERERASRAAERANSAGANR